MIYECGSEDLSDVLPLLSGPKVIFIVAMKEEENGGSKAHFQHISETELDLTSHIYRSDSILRAVHLVVPPGYPDWKPLKLRDLEFANSISVAASTPLCWPPLTRRWPIRSARRLWGLRRN